MRERPLVDRLRSCTVGVWYGVGEKYTMCLAMSAALSCSCKSCCTPVCPVASVAPLSARVDWSFEFSTSHLATLLFPRISEFSDARGIALRLPTNI